LQWKTSRQLGAMVCTLAAALATVDRKAEGDDVTLPTDAVKAA
jgi:hypothetical protein